MSSDAHLKGCFIAWVAQAYLVYTLPQMADEAYYLRWGDALSLGYFDHPPAIALWSALGGRLLNLTLLPIVWIVFADSARLLGARFSPAKLMCVAWCTPLGIASGVLSTPDAPLLLSWSIAVAGYARASWLLCALGLSMGMWSKAMIFPAASGLLWLWWSCKDREKNEVFKILLISCVLYSPHIWWSINHQGLPWSFQSSRGWSGFSLHEMLAGQLWVGGGLWFVFLVKCYWEHILSIFNVTHNDSDPKEREKIRVYFWLSAPSLIPWVIMSLCTRIEANWTALAWPFALIWLVDVLDSKRRRAAWYLSIVVSLPCLALPLVHEYIPLGWGPPRDGDRLRQCVQKVSDEHRSPLWIVGRYQEAALLGLPLNHDLSRLKYLRAHNRRRSQYDLLRPDREIHLPCRTLWIGPKTWVGNRCSAESVVASKELCQTQISICRCQDRWSLKHH